MKKLFLFISFISLFGFGFSQSVTTNAATGISYNDATLNGTFTDCNGGWLFNAKFEWGLSSGVYYANEASTPNSSNTNGSTASLSIDTLMAGTTYYYRFTAFDGGTTYYGAEQSFTTTSTSAPTVFSGSTANVNYTSFDVNGNNVVSNGGTSITEQGLVYSTTNNPPTTADSKQTYTPNGTGSYDVSLSSLTAGTTYYVRAYAINSVGTSYGSAITQATNANTVPTVVIATTIDNISKVDASNSGNSISSDGGLSITDKGVVWSSTNTSPTLSDNGISSGSGSGNFNGTIGNGTYPLTAGTKYYVRAYASNSVGDGYSSTVRNFITDTDDPALTAAASNINANDFDADWSTTTGAQGYYLDVATDAGFTSMVSGYNNLDVGNVTHKVVSGLTANTTYYYRIRAYHDGGDDGASFTSGNSGTNSVTTLVDAPTTQVSNMKWETINSGKTMSFNWSDGNGAGNMLIMKAGSAVQDPNGGTAYTGNANFGSGDNIDATGTYVVYNSTHAKGTSSVDVTGLTTGTTYYFKGLEYNGSGSSTNYNTTSSTGYNSGNSGSTALPINLISFEASQQDAKVLLQWKTASELNNNLFVIERSLDANNFEPVGKIQGSGTTNSISSYDFTDNQSPASVVYYRLKQIDYDGTTTTYSTISIDMSGNKEGHLLNKLSLLNTNLSLDLDLEANGAANITLMDINGKFIQGAMSTTSGAQIITFDMAGLSHGVYIIRIQQNDKIISRKLVY